MTVYEIAAKFFNLNKDICCPIKPIKPMKLVGQTNRDFGQLLDEYKLQLVGFREAVEAYHLQENKLVQEFKVALAKEHGLENHPKLDKLFDLAWGYGHSNGYTEVAICFDEFAELLK